MEKEISVIKTWKEDEDDNILYLTVCLKDKEYADVKYFKDSGFYYIMECQNGMEVYNKGTDEGIRNTTEKEKTYIRCIIRNLDK